MSAIRRLGPVTLERIRCTCARCEHVWETTITQEALADWLERSVLPVEMCASCRVRNWNSPTGTLKRGPKPQS